jgi:hypothetical protein
MTADEALTALRVKVHRAKQHVSDVERQVATFLESKPYQVGTKRELETTKLIYYVVGVAEAPVNIAAVTGDALQNLRSALDHLAYRLVVVGLGTIPSNPKYIEFPIADSQRQYPSLRDGKVKGARQPAKDAIDAVKPYPGGNDGLWRLHKLNNIDKHRLLLTVGSAFRSVDLGAHMAMLMREMWPSDRALPTLPSLFARPADRLFPLKIGDELFIGGSDDKVNEQMRFNFDVALGEPGIMNGEPLVETLHRMADLVDSLVIGFKPFLA